ncbi:MAG: prepilin-type N-terminal cleavage/methylation domain-containing protein [Candidatus Atribacteria bacterium]
MLWLRKSKKGFTLIELMVVVAIIGVLSLLGLRLYTGQQEKAKNAIVKANAGTIQTLIQAELADSDADAVNTAIAGVFSGSGIRNPLDTSAVQGDKTSSTAAAGEVWVDYSNDEFTINGIQADGTGNVYTTSLTARK